jgi:hypothetical protein
MAFRTDREGKLRWRRWAAEHRGELTEAGVPDWIWAEKLVWLRFLEEGGVDQESSWCVEMLSPEQAHRLRAFITREYGTDNYNCCLRSLDLVIQGGNR